MLTDGEKRILLQNRLFAELPAERLDGLLQKLSSRTACFGKNSVIWGMGERIDHAGIVLSGRVEAWRYTQDGQESLSAVHEAGGLFGDVLMSARTVGSPVELRTARPSKILFLSLDALLRCCAEDGGSDCTRLLSNLLEEISEKYWALQRHIRLLSIPDGRTRLEVYLRQEAGKTGEIVCAGMTRERMARYLGMNRSALSRLLSVTVAAPTCAEADALGTMFLAMGADDALAAVERMPGVKAYFILAGDGGEYEEYVSPAMEALILK